MSYFSPFAFYGVYNDRSAQLLAYVNLIERAGLLPNVLLTENGGRVELTLSSAPLTDLFAREEILSSLSSIGVKLSCCTTEECVYELTPYDFIALTEEMTRNGYTSKQHSDDKGLNEEASCICAEVKRQVIEDWLDDNIFSLAITTKDGEVIKEFKDRSTCVYTHSLVTSFNPDVLLSMMNRVVGFKITNKDEDEDNE